MWSEIQTESCEELKVNSSIGKGGQRNRKRKRKSKMKTVSEVE